ncbi:GNAT family N-acetyltransferase [Methylosinus sp. PW1]|uniref:GNAT family N-acetyltransferase n=1 Tax=Methylosinus sp. PW1 TaxID=107636 RepID=UPI000691A041|nr:GNAT family N-acetyltransferase [Methylosinus sp. PW1]
MFHAPARLDPTKHDFRSFDCGKPSLNEWLKQHAAASEGRSARSYVACEGDTVIGYYCISAGSIERAAMPSKVRKHGLPNPIPVSVIGRLARDLRYAGKGLGDDLLADTLKRILSASQTIGVRGVIVHALDEESAPFYTRRGFLPCKLGERTFFMPIETIERAI